MRSGSNWRSLVPFLLTAWSVPPGIDWLLVLAAALIYISPLYILLFSSFNPCLQLDKRGNWLFFLAERETTHKRAVAAFLLTFNHPDEKSNFPVNFCEEEQSRDNRETKKTFYQTLLESFIEVFMGRHDVIVWERVIHDKTATELKHKIRHLVYSSR